jgi:hypothetical protein
MRNDGKYDISHKYGRQCIEHDMLFDEQGGKDDQETAAVYQQQASFGFTNAVVDRLHHQKTGQTVDAGKTVIRLIVVIDVQHHPAEDIVARYGWPFYRRLKEIVDCVADQQTDQETAQRFIIKLSLFQEKIAHAEKKKRIPAHIRNDKRLHKRYRLIEIGDKTIHSPIRII